MNDFNMIEPAPVNWDEFNQALYPVKNFNELVRRLNKSFTYPFVCEYFNFSMPALSDYTRRLLGGDSRRRYEDYLSLLVEVMDGLEVAGVSNIQDLLGRTQNTDQTVYLSWQTGLSAPNIVRVLKYLLYWVVPMEKYLSGLVQHDSHTLELINKLHRCGVRTNLDLLQIGITPEGRFDLATASGLPVTTMVELVNRADFSRMPWSSKATISNIIGAGYPGLADLASADLETVILDYMRYGESIGKNLKLGNEIENSYRIARIVPLIVQN